MSTLPRHTRIAVIAFDGITPFHLSVPCLVFGNERADSQLHTFEVKVCAASTGSLQTSAGFAIAIDHDLSLLESADIVFLPAWHDDCRSAPPVLLDALRQAHRRGARLVGLCLGAFALAEAGLLDGKVAATHWEKAAELAERYPQVKVDRDVLYVDAGDILTSAGVAAGLDCSLYLLNQLSGADIANRVARQLLVAPHRQGGQAQFIERPVPAEGRFAEVLEWVAQNLQHNHCLDSLAERAAMSRRNFTRHFRQNTGTSFKQWLLNQRLAHAQQMLESSDASIERVAHETGFGTALSLRQSFSAVLRTSPSVYRKQFRLRKESGVRQ